MGKYDEQQLASYWNMKFKESMVTKASYTKRWQEYEDAYRGDYFINQTAPEYKSDLVSNYVFSIIETIRPIMLDNDPKFQAMPRQPDGVPYSADLQEAFSFEWDREGMTKKLYRELINTLTIGNAVFFVPWNAKQKEVQAIPVSAYNIFPDPLATCVEDAGYMIYASYVHVNILKSMFPHRAKELTGADVNYGELVYNNNNNAKLDNQVLVLECWTKDYESMVEDEFGKKSLKYPNGRVVTVLPELGYVLEDKESPYSDDQFPFVVLKDYDVPGKFWGEGEIAQLLSPQKYMNELNNAIIDHAKTTANSPWIVDKNAGVPYGSITSRQGLVIRKNPGSEVRREAPQPMPMHVINAVETYKQDMEQISGVFDTLKGNSETGVYTAQGILALQEAGQARVRLKVKLLEDALSSLARLWYSRMKQFWKEDRWVRITKMDGSYEHRKFKNLAFKQEYDIRITAGSTMPVNRGAMLDLMIRLAQTPMPDGQNLVDRESVIQYLPEEAKAPLLQRMQNTQAPIEQQLQEMQEYIAQLEDSMNNVVQQTEASDDATLDAVEDITMALEELNKKILQITEENDRIKAEKAESEKAKQIEERSYNQGYTDAEQLSASSMEEGAGIEGVGDESIQENIALPDEILEGLESLSDDELALIIEQNPQLAQLLGTT